MEKQKTMENKPLEAMEQDTDILLTNKPEQSPPIPTQEFVSLELPTGLKLSVGSSQFNVYQLADLIMQLKLELSNNVTKSDCKMVGIG